MATENWIPTSLTEYPRKRRPEYVGVSDKLQLFCILSLILLLGPSSPRFTVAFETFDTNPASRPVQEPESNSKEEDSPEYVTPRWKFKPPEADQLLNSRMIRSEGGSKNDKFNSVNLQYNRLSRALERIHFGPFLRLRSISNRATTIPNKFDSFDKILSTPQEKKAFSFFSRFYPVLQQGSPVDGNDSLMNSYTSRRRVSLPHSGEHIIPVGRLSRPVMRLRWGK